MGSDIKSLAPDAHRPIPVDTRTNNKPTRMFTFLMLLFISLLTSIMSLTVHAPSSIWHLALLGFYYADVFTTGFMGKFQLHRFSVYDPTFDRGIIICVKLEVGVPISRPGGQQTKALPSICMSMGCNVVRMIEAWSWSGNQSKSGSQKAENRLWGLFSVSPGLGIRFCVVTLLTK